MSLTERADRERVGVASAGQLSPGQWVRAGHLWSEVGVKCGSLMALLPELLGESPAVSGLRAKIAQLLRGQQGGRRLPPLLIQGETGTGKGLLARGIHRGSARADAPFVDVNCAAIPDGLLEAELFGFERGAFTGAVQSKLGLFQAAHHGTIFLDEIALLSSSVQAKLLKVLEDKTVRRLGSTRSEPADVWVVTATNEDLGAAIRERRFREDLYHRLAVVTLPLPPLRQRGDDVILLAHHFFDRACADYGLSSKRLDDGACEALRAYRWPGNVRELANVIDRAALLTDHDVVTADDLALDTPRAAGEAQSGFPQWSSDAARHELERALTETGWNISQAAKRLRIARNTVKSRMERFGLREPRSERPAPQSTSTPPGPPVPPPDPIPDASGEPAEPSSRRRLVAAVRVRLRERPDESITMRHRVLTAVVERLRAFGARVDELAFDACAGIFGLEPVEDAPRRAAYAALAVRQSVARQGQMHEADFVVGLAVHVADVTLFRVGHRWQLDPATHETFLRDLDELIEDTGPGEIAIGESAASHLDRYFALAAAADTLGVPTRRLRLVGARHTGYELWGRTTEFVGRSGELARLGQFADEAFAGRGQVVGIRGEPGGGKSRLLAEFRALSGSAGRWLDATSPSYGSAVPFLTAAALLRRQLDVDADASMDAILDTLRALTGRADLDDDGDAAVVALVGTLPAMHPFMMLPAPRRRTLMVAAAARVLLAGGERRPLVVAVEDVQWTDGESEEVLDALRHAVAGTRVLLVATYRSGYHPPWMAAGAPEIALSPLSRESAESVLDDLLGAHPSLAAVRGEILAKTGGNPFYLEESVRALVDSRAVVGTRRAFRMSATTASLAVPENVRAVVTARMDQLPAPRRRLLQCAAVIGDAGLTELLGLVAGLQPAAVRDDVAALRDAAFLSPASADADPVWEFRHALTHEAAYTSLLDLERKLLHAKVQRCMEALWAGRESEHADALADQAIRGEVWDRAIDYLRMASAPAYARAGLEAAIARLQTALRLIERLPASIDAARRAIDVRLDLNLPLITAGRVREIAEVLPDAERLARQIDDPLRLARVLRQQSQVSWSMGRHRLGSEYARQALAILQATPDAVTQIQTSYCLGLNLHALGEWRRAERSFAWVVEGPDGGLIGGISAFIGRVSALTVPIETPAWCWRGFSQAMSGDFAQGLESIRKGVELADTRGYAQSRIMGRTIQAIVMTIAGRTAERVDSMADALALCERIDFVSWLPGASSTYGLMLTRLGRVPEALRHLEAAVTGCETLGLRVYHAQRYCWWAEALLRAGDVAGARRRLDTAVDLAAAAEERAIEAEALLLRGFVARAERSPGAAHEDLLRSLALSSSLEARPLEAQAHLALAAVLREMGRTTDVDSHRARGEALCRDMAILPWWPDGYFPPEGSAS
jgi:transcriptional regulator with AAA-type ATPase domain/tetratricopeptide (TPR) repeat protein